MKKLLTTLAAAMGIATSTFAALVDLSTVTANRTLNNGDVVTGTLGGNYKISIADGAEVTLYNVAINGVDDDDFNWAGITCNGDATIILMSGTYNVVKGFYCLYPGIYVPKYKTLTLKGAGSLTVSPSVTGNGIYAGSGIGGGCNMDCGNIVIEGGAIEATGGVGSAGIGGGSVGGLGYSITTSCGNITINGGNVRAIGGGVDAAGIGCGSSIGTSMSFCGSITISGGTVSASGTRGIGCGNHGACGDIYIGDGISSVMAQSGPGYEAIGCNHASCGTVTVARGLDETTYLNGRIRILTAGAVDASGITGDKTLSDGVILTGTLGGNYKMSIADGATVTISNLVINGASGSGHGWAGLACEGDATIVLKGANTVRGFYEDYPGIYIPFGKTLTIKGDGALTASSNGYGAGIGAARDLAAGFIVIESGTVNATGGNNAAGIGGAYNGMCCDITIYKGIVAATGGAGAAGIGSGYGNKSVCGIVTVRSGVTRVTATCGAGAAPIGAGDGGFCDAVTVSSSLLDSDNGTTRTIKQLSTADIDLSTLSSGTTTLTDGTIVTGTLPQYLCKLVIADGAAVVLSDATINGANDSRCLWAGITCEGDATIVLKGANTVRGFYYAYPGIYVPGGKTLTIKGSGSLTASSNGEAAGIGAGKELACGNIVIDGGEITATGGYNAAGIGGGRGVGADNGNITINGGTVVATGGNYAAGIGGGTYRSCGDIVIGAGVTRVEATSGSGCETAIGAGWSGTCSGVLVDSALYDETSGSTRTIVAWSDRNLASVAADTVVSGGSTISGTLGGNYKITIADGATVRLAGVTIAGENDSSCKWAGITCAGDATIVLEGVNSVTGFYEDYPGIQVSPGHTLTIRGGGSLTASSNDYGAGIGGGYHMSCGNVVVESGTVNATGGYGAAGIGSGDNASCGNIAISGGSVTAMGGEESPGIGSGLNGDSCGDITIGTGVTLVWAEKGDAAYACIGRGYSSGTIGTVTVGGKAGEVVFGNVTDARYIYRGQLVALSGLYEDYTAKDGDVMTGETAYNVTVPGGATVTINGVSITGAGGGSAGAPEFSAGGKAATTEFVKGAGGKWTLTTFAELSNDALGSDVANGQIKVYAADTLEGLKTASPMSSGVTVTEKKSAVKTTIEVVPPGSPDSQFFKVKFGE